VSFGVVVSAPEHEVVGVGGAAVLPRHEVVGITPGGRRPTPGEPAPTVACSERFEVVVGGAPHESAHVDDGGARVHEPLQVGAFGQSACDLRRNAIALRCSGIVVAEP
jgi:hypothetical protein